MESAAIFFLTSGLFLGWSLGANDASNVFGTAVGTRMIRFGTAALLCSVFVVLGSVVSGAGAAHTLGKLGAVNALGGSFMAAFSAGLAVYAMTRWGLPVSTTQAIVGAIIAWNLFSETLTDFSVLGRILVTWLVCPLLAAALAVGLHEAARLALRLTRLHMLRVDAYTRLGLILAGIFGAYSLGANNIANVMGVFVASSPFSDLHVGGFFAVSSIQQLFLLGALAIGVGVVTYSKRVMLTVGTGLVPLSPVDGWVVVVAHSLVLFLFASEGLESLLAGAGLPTIPLVPVSSSQAVVGAVLGIGLLKGGRNIRWAIVGKIAMGWMFTPVISGVVCLAGLYVLQNVFSQQVYREVNYVLSDPVIERLEEEGIPTRSVAEFRNEVFGSATRFRAAVVRRMGIESSQFQRVLHYAKRDELEIEPARFDKLVAAGLSARQIEAVRRLAGRSFFHSWRFAEALAAKSASWRMPPDTRRNSIQRKRLERQLEALARIFRVEL